MNIFKKISPAIFLALLYSLIILPAGIVNDSIREQDSSVKKNATLDLHPFYYHESFEDKDPFLKWTSNGTYRVNSKGVSTEKASSGKKSFKLDLTFVSATYIYFAIPVKIPTIGNLNFKGDILISKVSEAKAALGTNISLSPCRRSGVNILTKQSEQYNVWKTQESNLTGAGMAKAQDLTYKYIAEASPKDVGIWTNKIGLYIFGKPGSSITLFIDNITIEGEVPDLQDYYKFTSTNWETYQKRAQDRIETFLSELGDYKKEEVQKVLKTIKNIGFLSKNDFRKLDGLAEEKNFIGQNKSSDDLMVFYWNPTSERKILPNTFPIPSYQSKSLKLTACPGEYEPASFILRAQKDISNINISASDFVNVNGDRIPASAIDIKYVKCWYQAGEENINVEKDKKYLTPELLLKDDSLIKVDYEEKKNYLKVKINGNSQYIDITDPKAKFPQNAIIKDADNLQSMSLAKHTNKQIWVTALIPERTHPGIYKGNIVIKGDNIQELNLDFDLEIMSFKLPEPPLEYSIYYRGKLYPIGEKTKVLGSEYKSLNQYKKELINMKQHGISAPTIYQPLNIKTEESIIARNQLGFKQESLYVLGTHLGQYREKSTTMQLKSAVRKWIDIGSDLNVKKIFIYGIDEGSIDVIRSQKTAWKAISDLDVGVFVACPKYAFDAAPGLLDIAIIPGVLDPEIISKWHKNGSKVYSYANPQVGVENPKIYREHYGIDLWINDYDGSMNYAYQHSMGHIWNDFDHKKYRDHVFAYPSSDGVIDTVQWEGFREGVDDLRYLNKLLESTSIDQAKRLLLDMKENRYTSKEIRENILSLIKEVL